MACVQNNFYCGICQKPFNDPKSAQDHFNSNDHRKKEAMQQRNSGGNLSDPYYCHVCCIGCNSNKNYQEHTVSAGHFERLKRQKSPFYQKQSSMASNSLGKEFEFDDRAQRGKCYICDIELTSQSHAKQHLDGEKHRKKKLTTNRNENSLFGVNSNLTCSVCNITVTGLENMQQHERSEKHKKKAAQGHPDLLISSPFALQKPSPVDFQFPNPGSSIVSYAGSSIVSNPGSSVISNPGSSIVSNPGSSVISNPGSNIVSVEEIRSLMSGSKLWTESNELANTDKYSQCNICNVSFSGTLSAEQHYSSEKHKIRQSLPKMNFTNEVNHTLKLLSTVGDKINTCSSSQTLQLQGNEQEYRFNGSTGYCFLCDIQLTSTAHKEQHIFGAKHRKASNLKNSNLHQLSRRAEKNGVESKTYSFINGRGRCFVCDIELTSLMHANQHLNGQKHIRVEERMKDSENGKEYPLTCDVCCLNFSGQECAKQHYVSVKHQKKAELKMAMNASGSDTVWGQMVSNPINPTDRTPWYVCEVCDCSLNTLEQLRIHEQSPKHHAKKIRKENNKSFSNSERSSSSSLEDILSQLNLVSDNDTSVEKLNRQIQALQEKRDSLLIMNSKNESTLAKSVRFSPAAELELKVQKFKQEPMESSVNLGYYNVSNNSTSFQSPYELNSNMATTSNTRPEQQNTTFDSLNLSSMNSSKYSKQFTPQILSQNIDGVQEKIIPFVNVSNNNIKTSPRKPELSDEDTTGQLSDSDIDDDGQLFGTGIDKIKKGKNIKPNFLKNRNIPYAKMTLKVEEDPVCPIMTPVPMYDDEEGFSIKTTSSDLIQSERFESCQSHLTSDSIEEMPVQSSGVSRAGQEIHRSSNHHFYCQLCNRPMNTEKAYEDHKKGKYHLQMMASQKSPRYPHKPIKKSLNFTSLDNLNLTNKSKPRLYQLELFKKAMVSDHVCFLPTGTGKTLVGVMTISYMLEQNPTRPVLFLVDKTLLVIQQALYLMKELGDRDYMRPIPREEVLFELESRKLHIAVLSGGIQKVDPIPLWRHDIIVTTAAFCGNLLLQEVIQWEDFSLVVMDEVHHCVKKHPYHTLIERSHKPLDDCKRPKILGLTASPAGLDTVDKTIDMLRIRLQNLGNVKIAITEGKRENEQLNEFQSSAKLHVECQQLSPGEETFRLQLQVHVIHCYMKLIQLTDINKNINGFPKSSDDISTFEDIARKLDVESLEILSYSLDCMKPNTEKSKVSIDLLRMHTKKILFAISDMENGSVSFALPELSKMVEVGNAAASSFVSIAQGHNIPCRELMDSISAWAIPGSDQFHMSSFQQLLAVLKNNNFISWQKHQEMALILVQRRSAAKILSHILQTSSSLSDLKVTHLVGHGTSGADGMKVIKQKRTLQEIKANKFNIVVATSVAEEGVDIPECQLVICLNPPSNVTALVQMRGRARKHGSHFVVICNSPEKEEKIKSLITKEENMVIAAKEIAREQM